MKTLEEVKGLGTIVEVSTDFATELEELKQARVKLITPRDEAYVRIKTENIGRNRGTWTTAGVEYAKGELPLLRLNSRLLNLKLTELAVQANRNREYFHTGFKREYEESLKQAEKDQSKAPSNRRVIVLPSRGQFSITCSENFEVLEFLLKDQAKKYFELNGNEISFYPVYKGIVDSQDGTLLTQLWFHGLDCGSVLYGDWDLDCGVRARGVQKSGEATQKISLLKQKRPYTLRQVDAVTSLVTGVREGELPASKLEKVVEFLEKLKE